MSDSEEFIELARAQQALERATAAVPITRPDVRRRLIRAGIELGKAEDALLADAAIR